MNRRSLMLAVAALALTSCTGGSAPTPEQIKEFVDQVVAKVKETCGVVITISDLIAAVTQNDIATGVNAFATMLCGLVAQQAPQVSQTGTELKAGRRAAAPASGTITVNGKVVHVSAE